MVLKQYTVFCCVLFVVPCLHHRLDCKHTLSWWHPYYPPHAVFFYDVLPTFNAHKTLVQLHTCLEHLNSLYRIPDVETRRLFTVYIRTLL
jgi:hypothetical protein